MFGSFPPVTLLTGLLPRILDPTLFHLSSVRIGPDSVNERVAQLRALVAQLRSVLRDE